MQVLGGRAQGARLERIRASARFRDGAFRNTAPVGPGLKKGTALSTMKEFVWGGHRRVPRGALPLVDPRETWTRPVQSGLRATWLGHSSVLLELDGLRVLTDPVWGERVSPLRLGQPVEPGHVQSVDAWWREVQETETVPAPLEAVTEPID